MLIADGLERSRRDLERFSRAIAGQPLGIEAPTPYELRLAWEASHHAGTTSSALLRSGMLLTAASLRWRRPWRVTVEHAASPLKFILARGPGPRLRALGPGHRVLSGGSFHVSRVIRPARLELEFDEPATGVEHQQLSLELEPSRLRDLLGAEALPPAIEAALSSSGLAPDPGRPMTPAMSGLLDEILHCDASGPSRRLYLEGKGLELLARLVDALEERRRATGPYLSQQDRDRLERARQILLARAEDPPRLPELARCVALNEVKLKVGFRSLFGRTVYGYLREHRLQEAHRLLLARQCTVSEVAGRVGYANPSKFAAAFRKRFGRSPSEVGA